MPTATWLPSGGTVSPGFPHPAALAGLPGVRCLSRHGAHAFLGVFLGAPLGRSPPSETAMAAREHPACESPLPCPSAGCHPRRQPWSRPESPHRRSHVCPSGSVRGSERCLPGSRPESLGTMCPEGLSGHWHRLLSGRSGPHFTVLWGTRHLCPQSRGPFNYSTF